MPRRLGIISITDTEMVTGDGGILGDLDVPLSELDKLDAAHAAFMVWLGRHGLDPRRMPAGGRIVRDPAAQTIEYDIHDDVTGHLSIKPAAHRVRLTRLGPTSEPKYTANEFRGTWPAPWPDELLAVAPPS